MILHPCSNTSTGQSEGGPLLRAVCRLQSFHLDTTDNSTVSAVDLELTGYCDSNTFSLDTLDPENFTSDEDPESSDYVTGIQPIEGLGEVFVDADSPDGPWVLVAYGKNGALPARLDTGGGIYNATRQDSASINALEFIKNAPKWLFLSRTGLQMAIKLRPC